MCYAHYVYFSYFTSTPCQCSYIRPSQWPKSIENWSTNTPNIKRKVELVGTSNIWSKQGQLSPDWPASFSASEVRVGAWRALLPCSVNSKWWLCCDCWCSGSQWTHLVWQGGLQALIVCFWGQNGACHQNAAWWASCILPLIRPVFQGSYNAVYNTKIQYDTDTYYCIMRRISLGMIHFYREVQTVQSPLSDAASLSIAELVASSTSVRRTHEPINICSYILVHLWRNSVKIISGRLPQ